MIRLIALDFILRLVSTSVMRISLVIGVLRMDLDDPAADMPGLRIPSNVITDLEAFLHLILPNAPLRERVQHAAMRPARPCKPCCMCDTETGDGGEAIEREIPFMKGLHRVQRRAD